MDSVFTIIDQLNVNRLRIQTMSTLVKSIFAMEEDENLDQNITKIPPEAADEDDTLNAYDESTDLASDADEIGIAIEQCMDVVAGLEAFHELIGSMEEEGLSPQTAAMADVALRSLGRTIGLDMDHVVPAMEEFSDKTGRKHYTKHIMHKIKLKLSVIWKHIVQFINSWKSKVNGFVVKLRDSAGTLAARAQKEIDYLEKNPDYKIGETTLNGTQYRNLLMKGSTANVASGLAALAERIRGLKPIDEMDTALMEYVSAIESLDFSSKEALVASYEAKKFKDACAFDTFVEIATKSAKGGLIAPINDKRFISPDITYRLEKPIYLGEHQLVYCMKQNPDKMLRGLVITWADSKRGLEFENEYKMAPPSVGAMISMMKAVVDVCGAIQNSHVDYMKRLKNIDLIIKTSNKFIKQLDAHKGEFANDEAYKLVRSYISGISSLATVMVEPALSLERQAMDSAKAAYVWCFSSVNDDIDQTPAGDKTPATESDDPVAPIIDDIAGVPEVPVADETVVTETPVVTDEMVTPEVPATEAIVENIPPTVEVPATEEEVVTTTEQW